MPRRRGVGLALALIYCLLWPVAGSACAFDMKKPERTQIDWIVDAEYLVLARPSDRNPFAFKVEQVLAGTARVPDIAQLVDSTTRRKLAATPQDAVLFAYREENGWRRVAYVNADFRPIMDVALAHRTAWQGGMPPSRVAFISDLHADENPRHKTLVIGELDKIPYPQLQTLDVNIPDQELIQDLWSREGYKYQAILALLLGLSGTPEARAEIQAYMARVREWDWAENLGAFAAAYIELDGVAAVEDMTRSMLLDPNQPLDKLEQIVMAFSVHHGIANPQVEAAVQSALAKLVAQRPQAAVPVARQFALRSDWSQAALLEPLVRERRFGTMGDLLTVSVYLARAREEALAKEDTASAWQ